LATTVKYVARLLLPRKLRSNAKSFLTMAKNTSAQRIVAIGR